MMANCGTAYFDSKGHFFKTPEEATLSDLAGLLGRVGEGESLAPGIAHMMLQKRHEIEKIFSDHDEMMRGVPTVLTARRADQPRLTATITAIR
jgi:hypothetical protein